MESAPLIAFEYKYDKTANNGHRARQPWPVISLLIFEWKINILGLHKLMPLFKAKAAGSR